jgi:hypothetical protein
MQMNAGLGGHPEFVQHVLGSPLVGGVAEEEHRRVHAPASDQRGDAVANDDLRGIFGYGNERLFGCLRGGALSPNRRLGGRDADGRSGLGFGSRGCRSGLGYRSLVLCRMGRPLLSFRTSVSAPTPTPATTSVSLLLGFLRCSFGLRIVVGRVDIERGNGLQRTRAPKRLGETHKCPIHNGGCLHRGFHSGLCLRRSLARASSLLLRLVLLQVRLGFRLRLSRDFRLLGERNHFNGVGNG